LNRGFFYYIIEQDQQHHRLCCPHYQSYNKIKAYNTLKSLT
jgi:hypothetical protein